MTAESVPVIADRAAAEAFLDERIGRGVKPGLDRIEGLLRFMGDPQDAYRTIHIAGTNGKTTVSRMVQQILGAHGFSTGGFTSPHLSTVEERFALHGSPVDAAAFTQAVADVAWFVVGYEQTSGELVTYFEVTAALAFSIFAEAAVDVAVIEVGLGGRLDATNVLDADVSVVTGVDIDHTEFLGTTIEEIAAEKAAVLKPDGTLVTGSLPEEAERVVAARVDETSSRWMRLGSEFSVVEAGSGVGGWQCTIQGVYDDYPELFLPVHGRHQVDHLATAIATSEMFTGRALDENALAIAVGSLTSPGRLEVVSRRPIVLLDGAHNPQGFRGLADTLDSEFPPLQWQLVIGLRGNRSVVELIDPLRGHVHGAYATAADDPASHDPSELALAVSSILEVPTQAVPDPAVAVAMARDAAGPDGGVIVAGSLYVVGEVRDAFAPGDDRAAEAHLRYEAIVDDDDDLGGEQEPVSG